MEARLFYKYTKTAPGGKKTRWKVNRGDLRS